MIFKKIGASGTNHATDALGHPHECHTATGRLLFGPGATARRDVPRTIHITVRRQVMANRSRS
jgi:hypothetical protein